MRTATEFIDKYRPNSEYPAYYNESQIEEMINEARIEAIKKCAEVVEMKQGCDCDKSQIDLSLILELIPQVK